MVQCMKDLTSVLAAGLLSSVSQIRPTEGHAQQMNIDSRNERVPVQTSEPPEQAASPSTRRYQINGSATVDHNNIDREGDSSTPAFHPTTYSNGGPH